VAIDSSDELLGCVTLIDDDELPNATEPGPWVAALFVHPSAREQGVANALLAHLISRAQQLGFKQLFLYSEDKQGWYEQKGWRYLRNTQLNKLPHVVMQLNIGS
jgi:N-acetylglutamate synthase-like GNAT family acetyltransferase